MRIMFYCLAATIVCCGCDTPVSEKGSYDYSIEQELDCFCPRGGVWVKLYVKADTIADAVRIADNNHLSYEEWRGYKTIKELFLIASRIDTSVFEMKMRIDSIDHYPSYLYFNPKPIIHGDTVQIITDVQMSYITNNYRRIN